MKKILFLLVVFFAFPQQGKADIIIFKSGSAKIGVIEEETPDQVKFRVKDVVVGISRKNIEKIEHSTQAENDKLRMKWKEEKEQLEEQRKKREAAEEKFEASQKEKGLVKVDGEWISPGEAEARRQQELSREAQSVQQKQASATQEEAPEELKLPPYWDDLSDEQREVVRENLKRQQKIKVKQVEVTTLGTQTGAKGTVMNGSDAAVARVELEISCFNENGDLIDVQRTTLYSLKPGKNESFYSPLRVPASFIKRVEANVTSVTWR